MRKYLRYEVQCDGPCRTGLTTGGGNQTLGRIESCRQAGHTVRGTFPIDLVSMISKVTPLRVSLNGGLWMVTG